MMSALSSAIICAVKFVNSVLRRCETDAFTRCQHVFDITAKPIDVDSNFLSYPAPLLCFGQNVII